MCGTPRNVARMKSEAISIVKTKTSTSVVRLQLELFFSEVSR